MKKGFVHTENFKRLTEAYSQVQRRGALEAGVVVVRGQYGIGKSELVERWSVDNGAIFVRAKETWSKRALLVEVAVKLGLDTRGNNAEIQALIIARQAVDVAPIVIDEADFLVRGTGSKTSAAYLEVIRDISDLTGCVVFLVGMEQFGDKLARFGHLATRVNRLVELKPLSLADVKATCDRKCEVPLGKGVHEILHAQTRGLMRLLINVISDLEQLAEANGLDTITADDLAGRQLCVEFKPGALARKGAAS